jgi:hypothetical protein
MSYVHFDPHIHGKYKAERGVALSAMGIDRSDECHATNVADKSSKFITSNRVLLD